MTEREPSVGTFGVLTLACGLAVFGLLSSGLFGERGVRRHALLERQLRELRARRAHAEATNARLTAEAQALRESPEYVEWVIRQELGWVRSGERVVWIEEP